MPGNISPLPHLHHLAIDTQCVPTPGSSVPTFWTTMVNLTRSWSSPLRSLSFKISEKIVLGDAFVSNIVNSHRLTLVHLSLRNCSLSKESMSLVCRRCVELETLKLSLPGKDMVRFLDLSPLVLSPGMSDFLFASVIRRLSQSGEAHTHHYRRRRSTWQSCLACPHPEVRHPTAHDAAAKS